MASATHRGCGRRGWAGAAVLAGLIFAFNKKPLRPLLFLVGTCAFMGRASPPLCLAAIAGYPDEKMSNYRLVLYALMLIGRDDRPYRRDCSASTTIWDHT